MNSNKRRSWLPLRLDLKMCHNGLAFHDNFGIWCGVTQSGIVQTFTMIM